MTLLLHPPQELDVLTDESAWPPEVDLILSALDTAGVPQHRQSLRKTPRRPLRVRAELRLFCDTFDQTPFVLYTRDVTPTHIGFLAEGWIPLGQHGKVRWLDNRNKPRQATCTVSRCRETVRGWFEGALTIQNPV